MRGLTVDISQLEGEIRRDSERNSRSQQYRNEHDHKACLLVHLALRWRRQIARNQSSYAYTTSLTIHIG